MNKTQVTSVADGDLINEFNKKVHDLETTDRSINRVEVSHNNGKITYSHHNDNPADARAGAYICMVVGLLVTMGASLVAEVDAPCRHMCGSGLVVGTLLLAISVYILFSYAMVHLGIDGDHVAGEYQGFKASLIGRWPIAIALWIALAALTLATTCPDVKVMLRSSTGTIDPAVPKPYEFYIGPIR